MLVAFYQTVQRHIPDVKNLKLENGMECGGLASLDPGEMTGCISSTWQ
jgi:hypothetical protein